MSGRFTLTAGQKGDAPQAAALIEGLPAEVVMADTAYDADHVRHAIAANGAVAVIPNNPSRALKLPVRQGSLPSATSWSAASRSSSSSDASQRDSRKPLGIFWPSLLLPLLSYGSDKCPHDLERDDFSSNCHPALSFCLSIISAQTRSAFVARENRCPLFRIML